MVYAHAHNRRLRSIIVLAPVFLLALAGNCKTSRSTFAAEVSPMPQLSMSVYMGFGLEGAPRPAVFLPGETIYMTLHVAGLMKDSEGRVKFSSKVEVHSGDGQHHVPAPTQRFHEAIHPGTNDYSFGMSYYLGPKVITPGTYRFTLLVEDDLANQSATVSMPFTVLEKSTFGAASIRLTRDEKGSQPLGAVFPVTEEVFIRFVVNGYTLQNGHLNLQLALSVLDEHGKILSRHPKLKRMHQQIDFIPEEQWLETFMQVPINYPGAYFVRLVLTDNPTGRTATYDIPVRATDGRELQKQHRP